ncbi:MAG: SDR family NAD(P)-dependent oxidoreductase, partial [Proteobacteria bacterium]|nr:SDR family NAD(P)-dependent oxidoreductase [Pseudomonadota bacterium]
MESIAQLMNLEGKVAIVTGGALGIGEAISMRLAEAGASVLIADINIEAAKRTAGNIVEKGGKAEAVKTDVSNANDTQQLIKA